MVAIARMRARGLRPWRFTASLRGEQHARRRRRRCRSSCRRCGRGGSAETRGRGAQRELVERLAVRRPGVAPSATNEGSSAASPSAVVSPRVISSRSRTQLAGRGIATGTRLCAKRPAAAARGGALLRVEREAVDVGAAEALEGGDEVGADALRHLEDRVARRRRLLPSWPPPSEPIGTRDMLSTPPATTSSAEPDATARAAKFTACRPEPQKRLSVMPVTSMGQPAASTALRAMLAPCSPACETQPAITSSTCLGRIPGWRAASAASACARSSCGCTLERAPLPALPRPRGVRTASMMKAFMADFLPPLGSRNDRSCFFVAS